MNQTVAIPEATLGLADGVSSSFSTSPLSLQHIAFGMPQQLALHHAKHTKQCPGCTRKGEKGEWFKPSLCRAYV